MLFELNANVEYKPNRGQWIQKLKTSDIIASNIVVNSKGLSFKTNFPNVFDQYRLYTAPEKLVMKWQDKSKALKFYVNCINFAVFCSTSGLGLSIEHFKSTSPLINSIIRFHLYYHVRKILYNLKVKLPYEKGFDPHETKFDKETYLELCTDYGVNINYDWRNQYIYSTSQGIINKDSWSRWIMPISQGLTQEGVEMLSETVRVYVYCLLSAQSSTRSNIIGNTGPNFEAQKMFTREVEDLIKRDVLLHEDIQRYENILMNARSPVNFSLGKSVYMLPSDLQLKKMTKIQHFSDKLKVGSTSQVGIIKKEEEDKKLINLPNVNVLPLREQRLSREHQEELQSVLLLGSIIMIGVVYVLKTK